LRELGTDLAGVGIDRIATHQDEIERSDQSQRRGESAPWPTCRSPRTAW
jgi:hypothetical protein